MILLRLLTLCFFQIGRTARWPVTTDPPNFFAARAASVNRVCKRFYYLMENCLCLWKIFEFDFPVFFDPPSFERVLTPARIGNFRKLCLPQALFDWSAPRVDFHLFHLFQATNLRFLDISGLAISSLAFLIHLRNLGAYFGLLSKYRWFWYCGN